MSHRVEIIRRITGDGVRVEVGPSTGEASMVLLSVQGPHPGSVAHLTMPPCFAEAVADAIYDRIAEIEMSDKEGE